MFKQATSRKRTRTNQDLISDFYPALNTHGIKWGNKLRIINGPNATIYYFDLLEGQTASDVKRKISDIGVSLGVSGVQYIGQEQDNDRIGIMVPTRDRQMVYFGEFPDTLPMMGGRPMPCPVFLGLQADKKPLILNLSAHAVIAGITGSGKSVVLDSVMVGLTRSRSPEWTKILFFDPKGNQFTRWNGLPCFMMALKSGVDPIITNPLDAFEAIRRLVGEMRHRYQVLKHFHCKEIEDLPLDGKNDQENEMLKSRFHIVAIFDEFSDLVASMGDRQGDFIDMCQVLSRKARSAGIRLIITTQRPSSKVLSVELKSQLPMKICLRVASAHDSSAILGAETNAHNLLDKGDMIVMDGGVTYRAQSAFISESELVDYIFDMSDRFPGPSTILKDREHMAPIIKKSESKEDRYLRHGLEHIENGGKMQKQFMREQGLRVGPESTWVKIGATRAQRIYEAVKEYQQQNESTGDQL